MAISIFFYNGLTLKKLLLPKVVYKNLQKHFSQVKLYLYMPHLFTFSKAKYQLVHR